MTEQEKESLKLQNQLCFPLYAAARKVVGLYSPYLKPLGITYTQYITFMVLWEHRKMTVGELGKQLYLDNGTLTPMLKKMEKEGYVTRSRSEEDERVVIVELTDKGMKMQEKCCHIPQQVGSCVRICPNDASELYDILYAIIDGDE